jgi:hypothetical protein
MRFLTVLDAYFRGERLEALLFMVPIGLASVAFGGWLLATSREAFDRGVAVPCVLLGLALLGTGGAVGLRTPGQVAELHAGFASNPEATRRAEIARMEKVDRAWPVYLTAWALFGVFGLILRFALSSDGARGVGVALVLFAGVGLIIDGFAERRARPYVQALDRLDTRAEQPLRSTS